MTEFMRIEVEGLPYGEDGKLTEEVKQKLRTQIVDRLRTTVPPEKLAAAVEKTLAYFDKEFERPVTEAGAANIIAALEKAMRPLQGLEGAVESLAQLVYARDDSGRDGPDVYSCGRAAAAIFAARVMLEGAVMGLQKVFFSEKSESPSDSKPKGQA